MSSNNETLRAAQGDGQPCVVGRELDALVAERVMNIVPIRIPFVPKDVLVTETFTDDAAEQWRQAYPYSIVVRTVPRYSAEIAAAMEVWDKLVANGWLPHLLTMVDGYVVNLHHRDRHDMEQVVADTREEAICRAALVAVAHNEGKWTHGSEVNW